MKQTQFIGVGQEQEPPGVPSFNTSMDITADFQGAKATHKQSVLKLQ